MSSFFIKKPALFRRQGRLLSGRFGGAGTHNATVHLYDCIASLPSNALRFLLENIDDRRLLQTDSIGYSYLRHTCVEQVLNKCFPFHAFIISKERYLHNRPFDIISEHNIEKEIIGMPIGQRIKQVRKELGITQVQLAKAAKVNQSTIADLERGRTNNTTSAAQIAQALGVNAMWLDEGKGEKLSRTAIQNFEQAPDVRDYVPLISMVQAGSFCEAIDSLHVGDSFEQIPTSYPKKRHTFALEVSGESMMPRFPPGMRLIVEPEMEYQSGDFVIAKNGGDATFKQIVKDGGVWYLKPLNTQFPTLPLADSHVIGVVREAVIKFR